MNPATPDPDGPAAEVGPEGTEPPTAVALPQGGGTWAVVVQPGSTPVDLSRALGRVPSGLHFLEAFGDVDIALVYQDGDGATPTETD